MNTPKTKRSAASRPSRKMAKIQKWRGEDGKDLISAMPDAMLTLIFSFLDMKTAVSTDVLSKKWQSLWTSNPNLVFEWSWNPASQFDFRRFIEFVNNTLRQCGDKLKRDKFKLECVFDESQFVDNFEPDVNEVNVSIDSWIDFAVRTKVNNLILKFWGEYGYALPEFVYQCSTLVRMNLRCCFVQPEGDIEWTSLTHLTIGCVFLTEDLIESVLSGSPALEYFELYEFYGLEHLRITSSSVKCLVLRDAIPIKEDDTGAYDFALSAPNLFELKITGTCRWAKCEFKDVSSLLKAELSFNLDDQSDDDDVEQTKELGRMVSELLKRLGHVEDLQLGAWCIEVLSVFLGGKLPDMSLDRCKCFSIQTCEKNLYKIRRLFSSFPELEKLILTVDTPTRSRIQNNHRPVKITQPSDRNKLASKLQQLLRKNGKVVEKIILNGEEVACLA